MSSRTLSRVQFEGPAGELEGLLHRPAATPRFLAVVAHPHPVLGGTMDSKVAWRLARGLEESGALVLRFNFRGAGASAGTHDQGVGEQDDVRAAARYLRAQARALAQAPLLLSGFSFGAAMSSLVACAGQDDVAALLLVGAPVRRHPLAELREADLPVGFVQGDADEHGPLAVLEPLVQELGSRARLIVVAGAGHFFDESQAELQAAVSALAQEGPVAAALAVEAVR